MTDSKPFLLIAMPRLTDPNFDRSVILVVNHSPEGALGIVLNRPTDVRLGDLAIANCEIHEGLADATVWYGGPCEPERIWLLHQKGRALGPEEMLLGDDLVLGSSLEWIQNKKGPSPLQLGECKFFSGYAGWVPEQLDQEIQSSAWLTAPMVPQLILSTPPEKIWELAVRGLGFDPSQLSTDVSTITMIH